MSEVIQKKLEEWIEDLRSKVIKAQKDAQPPFWASGKSADHLTIEFQQAKRIGLDLPLLTTKGDKRSFIAYATMQIGRKPGTRPPFAAIKQWIEDKGITPRGETTVDQLAFLISRAIGANGTRVHQGSRKGLDILSIVEAQALELADIIGDQALITISELIDDNLPVKSTTVK